MEDAGGISSRKRLVAVREALLQQLVEVDRLLAASSTDPTEEAARRMPCPVCKRMIMSAATTCGFCWHKLDPSAVGRRD